MKFSVLIPTKNRLEYLKYAIASATVQNCKEFEVVVSDNASNEDIQGYIQSLNDTRIIYSRSEKSLTVTENWNRCLDLCSGKYIIMLGDDDILLDGYFEIADKVISQFNDLDLIYTNAFLYSYPKVLPNFPEGAFNTFGSLHSMPQSEKPYELDFNIRCKIVQKFLNFETSFGTNMQHALIKRSLIEKTRINGKFFHSPYPDFYAMNMLFLKSEKTIIYPKEMVVIGITPKSHGYYYYNNKEKEAVSFLRIDEELASIPSLKNILLPVPGGMLSFWLGAMELLKIHFSIEQFGLHLNYNLYRKYQIDRVIGLFLAKEKDFDKVLKEIHKYLTLSEKTMVWFRLLSHYSKNSLPVSFKNRLKSILRRKSCYKKIQDETKPVGSPTPDAYLCKYQNALEILKEVKAIDCISEFSGSTRKQP